VLIARALAQGAPRLLLDEPTNHLDVHYQHEVLHLVRDLGLTTVVVLHDLNLAARYADRLVLLDAGRVVASGAPEDVLASAAVADVLRVVATPVRAADGHPQLLFRRTGT
jgi:iron complex transport system ATP-binding protein